MIVVVIIIDGFGVGAMADVPQVRPSDRGANTSLQIFVDNPTLVLPNLAQLGLINAIEMSIQLESESERGADNLIQRSISDYNGMNISKDAVYGVANLAHSGADTYWGHQEIMGSIIVPPSMQRFAEIITTVEQHLNAKGYSTQRFRKESKGSIEGGVLVVNNVMVIGDNMETDPGLNHNITADLDSVSFEEVRRVAQIVRYISKATRVIAFGGEGVGLEQILSAYTVRDGATGISAPLSGVYQKGYQVEHLGYAVDTSKQLPSLLSSKGVKTHLIGKVADIVINNNSGNTSISTVDTGECMAQTVEHIQLANSSGEKSFICTNIQETDLAGHGQDSVGYGEKLSVVDMCLSQVIQALEVGDTLIITADHGNDPSKGSAHTRERTPILVYEKRESLQPINGVCLGERQTLSDIGATVADLFEAPLPLAGRSFLGIPRTKNV